MRSKIVRAFSTACATDCLTNGLLWSFSLVAATTIFLLFKIEAYYKHKLAEQIACTAQLMK